MRLLLELALTHVLGRGRQTVVAGLGVALGVGFSVAMAALMQGSQDDFIRQLVDTMPHVAITDEINQEGVLADHFLGRALANDGAVLDAPESRVAVPPLQGVAIEDLLRNPSYRLDPAGGRNPWESAWTDWYPAVQHRPGPGTPGSHQVAGKMPRQRTPLQR